MSAPALEPRQVGALAGLPVAEGSPVLDVVIPVYNEEVSLGPSVARVHRYLSSLPFS